MTTPAPYPDSFFIIHHRFTGRGFKPGGVWGDIGDGPIVSEDDVIDAMIEAWDQSHEPDETDFKVWHIVPGKPAEDCTAWALRTLIETLQEEYEQ